MRGWVEFYMLFLQRNGILTLVILAVLLVRLLLRRQTWHPFLLFWNHKQGLKSPDPDFPVAVYNPVFPVNF